MDAKQPTDAVLVGGLSAEISNDELSNALEARLYDNDSECQVKFVKRQSATEALVSFGDPKGKS